MNPAAGINLKPSFAADPRFDRVIHIRRRRMANVRAKYSVRGLRGLLIAASIGAVGLAYLFSAAAALGLFAVLFIAFAYAWPLAAMAVILALTPIQNDLGGSGSPVRFAPAELAMFLAFPAALLRTSLKPRVGPTLLPTLLYLAVCCVASVDSIRSEMIVSMFQMALYMIVAVIVFSNLESRPAKLAHVFDLYVIVASALAIIGLITNFQFLGTHKNGWGASLSTALIVAVDQSFQARSATRRRLMGLALAIIGSALVMTVSRGGWMAALVGIAVVCSVRRQFGGLIKIAFLLVPVAMAAWYFLPQELRDYAFGFEAGRDNIRLRYESVDYAIMHWNRDPIIGVGVGLRKEYDATNIVLLTLAETGWAGLVTFLGVHLAVVYMMVKLVRSVRREGVMFSFAVLAVALVGARLCHGLVDHYWSRGPITCAWASVGLATLAYQAVRHNAAIRQRANTRLLTTRAITRPPPRLKPAIEPPRRTNRRGGRANPARPKRVRPAEMLPRSQSVATAAPRQTLVRQPMAMPSQVAALAPLKPSILESPAVLAPAVTPSVDGRLGPFSTAPLQPLPTTIDSATLTDQSFGDEATFGPLGSFSIADLWSDEVDRASRPTTVFITTAPPPTRAESLHTFTMQRRDANRDERRTAPGNEFAASRPISNAEDDALRDEEPS